uniref:Uncharacterized protein n=1 Tax=Ditylenchus dipsaci TaxID=166011 RepID=A0A915DTF2_9BILA
MFRIPGAAPPPPQRRPPSNKFARFFHDVYYDPLQWGLVKGATAFVLGVFVARQISEQLTIDELASKI